jgi:hypothetical protein
MSGTSRKKPFIGGLVTGANLFPDILESPAFVPGFLFYALISIF